MNARELLAGGLHDFSRYEKREPARVYICEPMSALELEARDRGMCVICEAFGQACCKLHRGEAVR